MIRFHRYVIQRQFVTADNGQVVYYPIMFWPYLGYSVAGEEEKRRIHSPLRRNYLFIFVTVLSGLAFLFWAIPSGDERINLSLVLGLFTFLIQWLLSERVTRNLIKLPPDLSIRFFARWADESRLKDQQSGCGMCFAGAMILVLGPVFQLPFLCYFGASAMLTVGIASWYSSKETTKLREHEFDIAA